MRPWGALMVLLAVAGALALRLPVLDARPLHNDEAVNAVKVSDLWLHGCYAYDPDEFHGPTLHYFSLPFLRLSGPQDTEHLTDSRLRLVTVAAGVSLVFLLVLLGDGLRPFARNNPGFPLTPALSPSEGARESEGPVRGAARVARGTEMEGGVGAAALGWAAVFTAVSPAMVFYSRYFIHEMLLVAFTALTIGAGWRYYRTRHGAWAVTVGAGLGLMWATKETFVLALAAMGFGLGATVLVSKEWREPGKPGTSAVARLLASVRPYVNIKHIVLGAGALLVVWAVLFSSFFTNFKGLADSVLTYLPWLKRAGGHSPHIYPWHFYLERLAWFHPARSPVWSEGLILLLALVGAVTGFKRHASPLIRFLAFYSFALLFIYSLISYKTPWCLLGFYHGMILLAGVGAAAVVAFFRGRISKGVAVGLLVVATLQLTWQSVRASFVYPADRRNPYVFAQTTPDLRSLLDKVTGLQRVAVTGNDTVVKVIMPESDYWPLPWSLRDFKQVGYYAEMPADPYAPIIIVARTLNARLDDKSDRKWIMAGMTELRPQVFLELYVELELWKKYVETLPRVEE